MDAKGASGGGDVFQDGVADGLVGVLARREGNVAWFGGKVALGAAQVVTCGALLTALGVFAGFNPAVAAVGAMGFVLSSTAVIMQILQEDGESASPEGEKAIAILLLEDLAIVPLLALVALWAALNGHAESSAAPAWQSVLIALGAIAALIAAGANANVGDIVDNMRLPGFGAFASVPIRP